MLRVTNFYEVKLTEPIIFSRTKAESGYDFETIPVKTSGSTYNRAGESNRAFFFFFTWRD